MTENNISSKKTFAWLNAAHFTCDVYTGFLNPIMPFIAAKLGFTMAVATIIISISQICSNMLQPVFGFFADNIYKRFFVFWGLILVSIFIPLAPLAHNLTILSICMILGCLGSSFFHPQSLGCINIFSKQDCSENMGFFVSMGSLGFAFGPLLAAYITQFVGMEKMIYTSVFGIILAFLMFKAVPKLYVVKQIDKRHKFVDTFKDIFLNRQMDLLILIAMMKSLITNSACVLFPFLWKSMNYSAFYIGTALSLFILAGALASFLSPKLEKALGTKKVIYLSLWATLPLMILYALIYKEHSILSMIMFVLMGFTTMLAQPVVLVMSQKILPQYRSIVAGFINGFCWGTIALLLSLLGFVAQNCGIMNVLLTLAFIPAITSYLVKYLKATSKN